MRLRFSFKTFLAAFTMLAVCIGIFAVRWHRAERQREVVAALRGADVSVSYKYETWNGTLVMNVPDPLGPENTFGYSNVPRWKVWLGRRFGRDFVFEVGHVYAFQPLSAGLVARLPDIRGLDHLHLNIKKDFDDEAWRALLGCRQIARLTLERDQIGPARPLTGLGALDQLQFLTVDGGEISVDDARAIAGLSNLRDLTLDLVSVTDESLQPFSQLTKLESFSLTHRGTGRNTTAAGVAFFTQLPRLRALGLGRLKSVDDHVFSQLELMPHLESLSLEQASITGAEIERLKRLPKLSKLVLIGTQVDDEAMQKLAKLTRLESLDISYTKVTDAGLKHVALLQNLRTLCAGGNPITDAGMAEIARLSRLEELMIVNAGVSDAGLEQIAKLPKLIAISLSGNPRVTKAGISKLKAALPNRNVYD